MNDLTPSTTTRSYADGLLDAAKMLELSMSEILLAAGEMTAQERRTIKAVLDWRARAIRNAAREAAASDG